MRENFIENINIDQKTGVYTVTYEEHSNLTFTPINTGLFENI